MSQTTLNWLDDLHSEKSSRAGAGGRLGNPRNAGEAKAWLSGGFPDRVTLPKSGVPVATETALERDGKWALQYGPTQGDPGLISELVKKLEQDQGIHCGPENIMITNGSSQGVSIVTELFVNPGDIVISEVPVWSGAVTIFRTYGAEVIEVDVDDEGTRVDQLESILNDLRADGKKAKMIYLIPTYQNPAGVVTTHERRLKIVDLAQEHNVPVIEDDAYFDIRFEGDRPETMYELDDSGLVLFLGTFSKIMAPGMRMGWIVAHPDIVQRLAALKHEGGTSPFGSHIAAEYAASGTLTAHIAATSEYFKRKRDAMLAALEEFMPEGVSWSKPPGGFFLWVSLPEQLDVRQIAPKAAELGVTISSGTACYYHGRGTDKIRLAYSFATEDEIRTGIEILADIVRDELEQTEND